MSSTKRTLWIDLTDLVSWYGNFTGIQTTVFNIAREYAKDPDVRFFAYSEKTRFFKEVVFDQALEHILDFQKRANETEASSVEDVEEITTVKEKTSIVRSIARIVIPPPARRSLLKSADIYRQKRATMFKNQFSHFGESDDVLILGGNWGDDNKNYLIALEREKKLKGLRIYHVIYDMIPVKFPNYYAPGSTKSYERYMNRLITISDGLFAISKSTKNDMLDYIATRKVKTPPPVVVFRLGEDFEGITPKQPKLKKTTIQLQKGKFIMYVSTMEARKNHAVLYYAVKQALHEGKPIVPIIIVGRRGWMTGDIQHMIDYDPEVSQYITIQDNIDDGGVNWLYDNCLLTVYPSFYEGWGIPPAESLFHGKLCISSGQSSMPEVGGDLVEYFSPYNSTELLEKIRFFSKPSNLAVAEKKIQKNFKPFTWYQSYENFAESLDTLRNDHEEK